MEETLTYEENYSQEEMIFEDQESSTDSVIGIPEQERKIITQAYDKSVADVVRMINDKEIHLDPEYQRNYVWDNKKASMLIESIILNVPIPVIYVSQEKDDTWTVIDGLQRLTSLKKFFAGNFKLSGLDILGELNKCDINSLNPKAARILKNGLLRVIMISNTSNEEIKYDVFMRLNTGSVHLTEQELRNCLYRGSFNNLLKELTKNGHWLAMLGLREPHKRMADRELILRFFALQSRWHLNEGVVDRYAGKMKVFLNEYMCAQKSINAQAANDMRLLFEATVEKVYCLFGDSAFRQLNRGISKSTVINRALMDALMISVIPFEREELLIHSDVIAHELQNLIDQSDEFRNSLQNATSDTKVLNYRLKTWCEKLNDIMENRL